MKPRPKDLKPTGEKKKENSKTNKLKEYIQKLKDKFKCSCTIKFD